MLVVVIIGELLAAQYWYSARIALFAMAESGSRSAPGARRLGAGDEPAEAQLQCGWSAWASGRSVRRRVVMLSRRRGRALAAVGAA